MHRHARVGLNVLPVTLMSLKEFEIPWQVATDFHIFLRLSACTVYSLCLVLHEVTRLKSNMNQFHCLANAYLKAHEIATFLRDRHLNLGKTKFRLSQAFLDLTNKAPHLNLGAWCSATIFEDFERICKHRLCKFSSKM